MAPGYPRRGHARRPCRLLRQRPSLERIERDVNRRIPVRFDLLASATITTRTGLRSSSVFSHSASPGALVRANRITLVAPTTSRRRMERSSALVMPPSRSLPPLEFWRGTSPNQAAICRPFLKTVGSGMVAARTNAVIGPRPGMVACLRLAAFALCQETISRSSTVILVSEVSICPVSSRKAARAKAGIACSSRFAIKAAGFRRPWAATMQHQDGLLVLAIDRHEGHLRPGHRLGDGRCIVGVVLLAALHVCLDPRRHDQPGAVPEHQDPPSQLVRRGAGFHPDQTRRQFLEITLQSVTSKLTTQNNLSVLINRVNLQDALGKIETNGDYAPEDGPPECGDSTPTTLRHSMPLGLRSSTPPRFGRIVAGGCQRRSTRWLPCGER